MLALSRRTFLSAVGASGLAAPLLPLTPAQAASSLRARFHMTPPKGWLCDPQRPVVINGTHHLFYLHSDTNNADGGWDHATTTDLVNFTHHGPAIPLTPNFPVWTGSAVVDTRNTAGYGPGAVIVLATQPTSGIRKYQEQYLYWSTDGGRTFQRRPQPVIVNTDGRTATTPDQVDNAEWFRDPKVVWDPDHSQWVCIIGRRRYASLYTSKNLIDWTWKSNFDYLHGTTNTLDLGGIECPDLFQITADDSTSHWVLGASMDADSVGLPMTYAYWIGTWNGTTFTTDNLQPQWLDRGWDWYAAVTWENPSDPTHIRYAIGWMNNWKYAARSIPTDATDGYNGQNSVVRELRLQRQPGGFYTLLSQPTAGINQALKTTTTLPDRMVNGSTDLEWKGRAYRLDVDISWTTLNNVGVSVGQSSDHTRHTNIGKYGDQIYVDRGPSDRTECSFTRFTRAAAPIDPAATSIHLSILVDMQSVEVFVNAGHTVLSQQVYFRDGDDGISFYTDGGPAQFRNITIRTL